MEEGGPLLQGQVHNATLTLFCLLLQDPEGCVLLMPPPIHPLSVPHACAPFTSCHAHSGLCFLGCSGEPPLVLSVSVLSATREAIQAVRQQNGQPAGFFRLNTPATPQVSSTPASQSRQHVFWVYLEYAVPLTPTYSIQD